MAARPVVQVQSLDGKEAGQIPLPEVMQTPIRPDVVVYVFTRMNKNTRQPYGVFKHAGHQTSAESWGTGRAVARIPRVAGGGTHRAGQGAFGNMCRKGRMFAPIKTYRKWHAKTNVNQRRFAVCSALAASAVPALVMSHGHKIEKVNEIPLVIGTSTLADIDKTKKAIEVLKKIRAYDDVVKVKNSRGLRAGKGKRRNRRYVQRCGPLMVFTGDRKNLWQSFRNLPGMEFADVDSLSLLQLAPGGHLGRFVIWTADAFARLDEIFGTYSAPSKLKKGFHLPRPIMANPNVGRIINSTEIQSRLRPIIRKQRPPVLKKNPLKNRGVLAKLNPYAIVNIRNEILHGQKVAANKEEHLKKKREIRKKNRQLRKKQKKVLVVHSM